LQNLIANGRLLCLDRDSAAIAEAKARFASDPRVALFLAPFSALGDCADQVEPGLKFDGILFDLTHSGWRGAVKEVVPAPADVKEPAE